MVRHINMVLAATVLAVVASAASAQSPNGDTGTLRPKGRAGRAVERAQRRGITAEQEKEVLAVLKEHRPQEYERLMDRRTTRPLAYRWELQALWRRYQRIRHLPREVREAAMVEMESKGKIVRLVREYRAAAGQEKLDVEKALREAIAAEFDAQQAVKAHRLGQYAKHLERMKADLAARAKRRDREIQKRFERAIGARADKTAPSSSRQPHRADPADASPTAAVMMAQPARVIFVQDVEKPSVSDRPKRGPRGRNDHNAAKDKAELLSLLEKRSPTHYDRLKTLEEDDPEAYGRLMNIMMGWYRRWRRMPVDVQGPAMTMMERQVTIYRLARDYKRAENDSERRVIAPQLKTAIGEHFDAELKVRAYGLKVIEKRLDEMRAELTAQAARRDAMIAERFKRYVSAVGKFPKHRPRKKQPAPATDLPEADRG